jgi:hypothetical protein
LGHSDTSTNFLGKRWLSSPNSDFRDTFTVFAQFLVAQTDKGLRGRPCVILMGYPAPRTPNVAQYLRRSDSGLARRITDTFAVPNFTPEMVRRVFLAQMARRGVRLGCSEKRFAKCVALIPERFYALFNGALAEKLLEAALGLRAMATYADGESGLEARLTLTKPAVKAAASRVVADLTRDEQAMVSG